MQQVRLALLVRLFSIIYFCPHTYVYMGASIFYVQTYTHRGYASYTVCIQTNTPSRLLTSSWRGHGEMHRFISHNANTPALWEWDKNKSEHPPKNSHMIMTFGPQKTKHTHSENKTLSYLKQWDLK